MRFLRIVYRYFGPLEHKEFDLSKGQEGLYLFYGPNEAGKTTALRGLKYLLFGFPMERCEDFRYPAQKQQLEAHLRDRSGEELRFMRVRSKKNPLRSLDGSANLSNEELQRFLGGLTEKQFEMLFGLDHTLLVEGGRQIVEGQGALGEALFAAAAGMAGLRKLQKTLRDKTQQLYAPRATKTTKINPLLASIQQNRDQEKEATLRLETWQTQVAEYQTARQQKETLSKQRQEVELEIRRLERAQAILTSIRQYQDLSRQLQSLPERAPILDDQQTIQELREGLGQCRKANEDRKNLLQESARLKNQALGILRTSFGLETLEQMESLCPSEVVRRHIQQLAEERKACLEAHENAQAKLRQLTEHIEDLEHRLAEFPSAADGIGLQVCYETVLQEGPLEKNLQDIQVQLAEIQDQIDGLMARLRSCWAGSLEEAVDMRPPPEERAAEYQQKFHSLSQQRFALEQKIEECQKTIRSAGRAIRQLEKQGEIPSQQMLAEARTERDAGVELVRAAWLEPDRLDRTELEAFVQKYAPGGHLLEALQKSIHHCDQLADRLHREAHRAAEQASQQQRRSEAEEELHVYQQKLAQLQQEVDALQQAWQAEWTPWDITPQTPSEMIGWLHTQTDLRKTVSSLRRLQEQRGQLQEQIAAARQRLQAALALDGSDPQPPLQELLALAKHRIAQVEQQRNQRQEWETQLDQLRRNRQKAEQEALSAQRRLEEWAAAWQQSIGNLALPKDALPETVHRQLEQWTELRQLYEKAQSLDERIEGIDRDSEAFLRRLQQLRDRHNLGYPASTLQTMQADLDTLQAQLHHAQQAETRRQTLQNNLDALRKELLQHAGSKPLEEFCEEILQQADTFPSRLETLHQQAEELDAQINRVSEAIGRAQQQIETWEKAGNAAAQLRQQRMAMIAQLREYVVEYAAHWAAQKILAQAMENFRQRHQETILNRAAQYFQILTCGAFQRLEVVEEENNHPALKAVRTDPRARDREEWVDLEGLSDGARDQLFLALRLAGIEDHCDHGEPMPVIIDDVLINFDNQRAAAAFKALAELSRKTQILLFTHHEHLVELAKRCLPAETLFCDEF